MIVIRFQKEVKLGYDELNRKAAPVRAVLLPFPDHYREILEKYFTYYKNLSTENRQRFEQRVLNFILSKRFVARQFDRVTDEMKVMIAACAVQLTFGLPKISLQHFKTILIYPDAYYSSITKRFHKGEVNPAYGVIVLSWKSFVEGYLTHPHDALNLGLHELAHALRLENIIRNEEYQFFDEELLDQFDAFAYRYCHDPNMPEAGIIRPYACTNEHEFFSVAVENFFERPQAFHDEWPKLYFILARLLNQDPLKLGKNSEL